MSIYLLICLIHVEYFGSCHTYTIANKPAQSSSAYLGTEALPYQCQVRTEVYVFHWAFADTQAGALCSCWAGVEVQARHQASSDPSPVQRKRKRLGMDHYCSCLASVDTA